MDEGKKAEVIALFADMKAAAALRKRKLLRKKQAASGGGTHIINSTIVVCGDQMQALVAELLSQKQWPSKGS